MRHPFVVSTIALVALFATAPALQGAECVKRYDPRTDYFPARVRPAYADGFTVEYRRHYKLVTVKNPWRGAKTSFQYVLVQCGTPTPPGFAPAQVIEIPVRTVAALSTAQLVKLEKLGLVDRLVSISEAELVHSPAVNARVKAAKIVDVGQNTALNIEKLLQANPALVFTFGLGREGDSHPKLVEAGLKVALTADYMEETPLGRSEWLKYTALFFNREAEANRQFDRIARRYRAMAAAASRVKTRPTVFTGFSYRGTWYVSGGKSYFARFLKDAGANYLWADNPDSAGVPLGFEAVYSRAADADFWINQSGSWQNERDLKAADERHGEFKAVREGRVYNNNARLTSGGGNDYWQSGGVNPDIVLADLIRIFHPGLLPRHKLVYYRHLGGGG